MRSLARQSATAPTIVWEECACLLCGSPRLAPWLEAGDSLRFLVVRCERCGLAFTNPRPNPESIRQFYPADYRCHRATADVRPDPLGYWLPMHGQCRLLDFGCGGGDFLEGMRALGWNAVGIDICEEAVQRVRQRGLDAHVGSLPAHGWSAESFEAITMRQSLEHVHHPLEVLHAAYRLLTMGGTLLVSVPNVDSFAARFFGPTWYGLDLPRHLTHFTPVTLRLMLQQAGFSYIDVRHDQHHSWIRHSAERARGLMARMLRTRLGAGIAGAWGRLIGRPEGIAALAIK